MVSALFVTPELKGLGSGLVANHLSHQPKEIPLFLLLPFSCTPSPVLSGLGQELKGIHRMERFELIEQIHEMIPTLPLLKFLVIRSK